MSHWKKTFECPYCNEPSPNEAVGDDGTQDLTCLRCGKRYKYRQYTEVHTWTAKMRQPKKAKAEPGNTSVIKNILCGYRPERSTLAYLKKTKGGK